MIVLDTSGLLCLLDAGEPDHTRARAAVESDAGPSVTIDLALAETDYLILRRLGRNGERKFLSQLLRGAFLREAVTDADLRRAMAIIERFRGQDLGLTDAALMAVAERLEVRKVLTLDHRHFGPFRDRKGPSFELLPAMKGPQRRERCASDESDFI